MEMIMSPDYGYTMTKKLGAGGFGSVYQAVSITNPSKEVAIKVAEGK
jgi:serine/threonine protein kinase